MKKIKNFSWQRLFAVMIKEVIQMRRDLGTLAMMLGIPMMQVILFGYAINSDPRHLPTAVVAADSSQFVRTFVQDLQNTGYYNIEKRVMTEAKAEHLLATSQVEFILNIPPDFTRQLVRGERPSVLLEADATDPLAAGNAIAAANILMTRNLFQYDFNGQLDYLQPPPPPPPINLIVHPKYNPGIISQYNIVPGLMGIELAMILTMTTAIAITRERDRGTLECLLSSPLRPLEIMLGKIIPYIFVGYVLSLIHI